MSFFSFLTSKGEKKYFLLEELPLKNLGRQEKLNWKEQNVVVP